MERIVSTPDVINGNPRVSGSRISVLDVVLACSDLGLHQILEQWPGISEGDINEAIRFCEKRECEKNRQYCGGCTLRLEQDEVSSMQDFIDRFSEIKFLDSVEVLNGRGEGIMVMPGNASTLDQYWRGIKGWEVATRLRKNDD